MVKLAEVMATGAARSDSWPQIYTIQKSQADDEDVTLSSLPRVHCMLLLEFSNC